MIYMSKAALRYAVEICEELDDYRVTVICSKDDVESNFLYLLSAIHGNAYKVVPNEILFDNGSIIRIGTPDYAKASRSYLVVLDEKCCSDEYRACVITPIECIRYSDVQKYKSEI